MKRAIGLAAALALSAFGQAEFVPTFTPLGDLPGGAFSSYGGGVSADGLVAVGFSMQGDGRAHPFRWTRESGMVALGIAPGSAFAASADGSVVVGDDWRWTAATGRVPLGASVHLAGDVSLDGWIVGCTTNIGSIHEAARWESETAVGCGDLPGGDFYSSSGGLSADGEVVVGSSRSANGYEAFRWTAADGMVGLGDLPGGEFESVAIAVSGDGRIVTGWSWNDDSSQQGFRWTAETGMVSLGFLAPGAFSYPYAVNYDGTLIAGSGGGSDSGFIWDAQHGMRDFQTAMAEVGLETSGWILGTLAMTPNGRVLVGTGRNPAGDSEAWMISLPPVGPRGDLNCDGSVNNFDIDPFVQVLTDRTAYVIARPWCDWRLADTNHDGTVDNFDIDFFVDVLIGE